MSQEDARIAELDHQMQQNEALIRETRAENERLAREFRILCGRRTARKCRKRKWLYVTANMRWNGPLYGAKVRVTRHGNKYVYVEWHGRGFRFPYQSVSTEKPGSIGLNRHLASVLDTAGVS